MNLLKTNERTIPADMRKVAQLDRPFPKIPAKQCPGIPEENADPRHIVIEGNAKDVVICSTAMPLPLEMTAG